MNKYFKPIPTFRSAARRLMAMRSIRDARNAARRAAMDVGKQIAKQLGESTKNSGAIHEATNDKMKAELAADHKEQGIRVKNGKIKAPLRRRYNCTSKKDIYETVQTMKCEFQSYIQTDRTFLWTATLYNAANVLKKGTGVNTAFWNQFPVTCPYRNLDIVQALQTMTLQPNTSKHTVIKDWWVRDVITNDSTPAVEVQVYVCTYKAKQDRVAAAGVALDYKLYDPSKYNPNNTTATGLPTATSAGGTRFGISSGTSGDLEPASACLYVDWTDMTTTNNVFVGDDGLLDLHRTPLNWSIADSPTFKEQINIKRSYCKVLHSGESFEITHNFPPVLWTHEQYTPEPPYTGECNMKGIPFYIIRIVGLAGTRCDVKGAYAGLSGADIVSHHAKPDGAMVSCTRSYGFKAVRIPRPEGAFIPQTFMEEIPTARLGTDYQVHVPEAQFTYNPTQQPYNNILTL